LNPRTRVPVASMLTTRPPKPSKQVLVSVIRCHYKAMTPMPEPCLAYLDMRPCIAHRKE
jgi:hypothetical protein